MLVDRRRAVVSELALCAVTVVSVGSLLRIFDHGTWLATLVVQAIVAHALAAGARRAGWSTIPSVLSVVTAGAATIAVVYAGASPGDLIGSVSDSFAGFGEITAPVPAEDGFLIACAGAVWVVAVLADWWAFRLRATIEATIPAGALFVVATILGADRQRAAFAGAFIGAVLVHVLVTRTFQTADNRHWIDTGARSGTAEAMRLGTVLVVVVTVLAVVVVPRLPSATAEGAVDLRDLDGSSPEPRVTVSPLVDIHSRLVDQPDVVAFQVRSDVDAYWRLTSLDRFDGRIWASSGSFGDGNGDLDSGVPVDADRTVFEQEIRILALQQLWAPAAYEPRRVDDADVELRYDESSGTLVVGDGQQTSDGIVYTVTSARPVLDPARLATATTEVPSAVAERYLDLPGDFPADIAELARDVTADADTTYAKALELQSFFRSEFEYSLDLRGSHSVDAMSEFLFTTRTGYCEQFAGTYAAMARSLGIPARVAVGFTPGDRSEDDPGVLNVRGLNAHAWPEVYLGEFGWVSFEPTPGRGAPGAETYTGVPAQQAVPEDTPDTSVTAPPSTVPSELTTPPTTVGTPDTTVPTDVAGDDTPSSRSWPGRVVLVALAVLVIVGVYVAAVWSLDALGHRRRRRSATTEEARIATAWEDAVRALADVGIAPVVGETQTETARRVGRELPDVASPVSDLATVVEETLYSPRPPVDGDGSRAYELADSIRVHVEATQQLRERLRRKYDPRVRLRR